ncbi:MAG: hypothetical protein AB7O96_04415 [Pseudobdellovibrionaceae bacterium]
MSTKIRFLLAAVVLGAFLFSFKEQFFGERKEMQSGSSDFGSIDPDVPKEGYEDLKDEVIRVPPEQHPEKKVPEAPKPSSEFSVLRNNFWAAVPSVKEVRQAVRENPHSSPRQYGDLAKTLVPLMEHGLATKENAEETFPVLKECVKSPADQVPVAVRASCLKLARELMTKYPVLKDDFESLHDSIEGRLKRHVAVVEKLEASLRK